MLDRISIPAPCSAEWDSMPGDDRVRHCAHCDKNVYNLSAMSRREAEKFLRETQGHACARIYYRPDGTAMTERCPAILRAAVRRISRIAGTAMSAIAALAPIAPAQIPLVQITPEQARRMLFSISGLVTDFTGAVIPSATIEVSQPGSDKKVTTYSDARGTFRVDSLPAGSYTVRVSSTGFATLTNAVVLRSNRDTQLRLALTVANMGDIVVVEPTLRSTKK